MMKYKRQTLGRRFVNPLLTFLLLLFPEFLTVLIPPKEMPSRVVGGKERDLCTRGQSRRGYDEMGVAIMGVVSVCIRFSN